MLFSVNNVFFIFYRYFDIRYIDTMHHGYDRDEATDVMTIVYIILLK